MGVLEPSLISTMDLVNSILYNRDPDHGTPKTSIPKTRDPQNGDPKNRDLNVKWITTFNGKMNDLIDLMIRMTFCKWKKFHITITRTKCWCLLDNFVKPFQNLLQTSFLLSLSLSLLFFLFLKIVRYMLNKKSKLWSYQSTTVRYIKVKRKAQLIAKLNFRF